MKSLSTKLAMYMAILLLVICIGLGTIAYLGSTKVITKEIEDKIECQRQETVSIVETFLSNHKKLVLTLANFVKSVGTDLTPEQYKELLMKHPLANEDTLGSGVWFEPYQYQEDLYYFGPYAYKDNGTVVYTEEYSNAEYDYHQWEWYTLAVNTTKDAVWTDPYYDETTGITMVSTTGPFYDSNGEFKGVVTSDLDLTRIQEMIQSIKVGDTGKAYLLNKEGYYIVSENPEEIMQLKITEHQNKELAEKSKVILEKEEGEFTYSKNGKKYNAYFANISETDWKVILEIPEEEILAGVIGIRNNIIIATVFVLVMGIFIALYIGRALFSTTDNVAKFAEKIANGELNVQIPPKFLARKDEIGRLAKSFDLMINSLQGLVKKISTAAVNTSTSSQELSAIVEENTGIADHIAKSAQEVVASAQQQAYSVQNTSATIEQMSASVQNIAANLNSAAQLSEKTVTSTEEGKDAIEKAISQMNNIGEVSQEIQDVILRLTDSSAKIEEIVGVINNISEQTNLLALNAAIEAARAGDAGRGFAVVAEEVRKLAEQTGNATQQIVSLISDNQINIDNANLVTNKSANDVKEGVAVVNLAGEKFIEISNLVSQVSLQIGDISAAIQQMADGSQEVVAAINKIDDASKSVDEQMQAISAATEEQSASMEEIAAASQELANMAKELQDALGKFKL